MCMGLKEVTLFQVPEVLLQCDTLSPSSKIGTTCNNNDNNNCNNNNTSNHTKNKNKNNNNNNNNKNNNDTPLQALDPSTYNYSHTPEDAILRKFTRHHATPQSLQSPKPLKPPPPLRPQTPP